MLALLPGAKRRGSGVRSPRPASAWPGSCGTPAGLRMVMRRWRNAAMTSGRGRRESGRATDTVLVRLSVMCGIEPVLVIVRAVHIEPSARAYPQTALSLCVAGSFWRRRAYASIANGVWRWLGARRMPSASSFRASVRSVGASDPRKRSPSWPLAYCECPGTSWRRRTGQ